MGKKIQGLSKHYYKSNKSSWKKPFMTKYKIISLAIIAIIGFISIFNFHAATTKELPTISSAPPISSRLLINGKLAFTFSLPTLYFRISQLPTRNLRLNYAAPPKIKVIDFGTGGGDFGVPSSIYGTLEEQRLLSNRIYGFLNNVESQRKLAITIETKKNTEKHNLAVAQKNEAKAKKLAAAKLKKNQKESAKRYNSNIAITSNYPSLGSRNIPSIYPANGILNSKFGYRRMGGKLRMHKGVDICAPLNTPIVATADGVVLEANNYLHGYGNRVLIGHGNGYKTHYAHMNRFIVTPGQRVKRGQIIGYMGRTGHATGVHVHYEVLRNGVPVNPMAYLGNFRTAKK